MQEYLKIYEDDHAEAVEGYEIRIREYQKELKKLEKELMAIKSRKSYKLQRKYDHLKSKIR